MLIFMAMRVAALVVARIKYPSWFDTYEYHRSIRAGSHGHDDRLQVKIKANNSQLALQINKNETKTISFVLPPSRQVKPMPGLLDIFESILNQAGQAHDQSRSVGGQRNSGQRSSRRRTNFPQLDPLPEPGRGRIGCLLYTSPSPRDRTRSRMPSSA